MESYRIFSFTVQVIIILLSKSNDNLSDATKKYRLSKQLMLRLACKILKCSKIIYYLYIYYIFATCNLIYILQVIIDNEENIVHVQSGFLGHENDANCCRQIGSIGPDAHLKCPDNCYILGDCIYLSGYPVITPYKVTDIIDQP